MPDKPEHCQTCGNLTDEARRKRDQERVKSSKLHPIYGTNLDRKKSEIIEEIRSRLCAVRGSLSDFRWAFPGWHERTEPAEGGITCIISALHHVAQELRDFETKNES